MQHALGRLEEVAPRSRQPDARAVTLKHRNPQFALDPCYAPTDCRGLHTRGHSGSTNVKRLGNVDEGAEISEFHHALQTTMKNRTALVASHISSRMQQASHQNGLGVISSLGRGARGTKV